MFGDQYGVVNTTLQNLGLPAVPWHSDAFASHIAIATMVNFRWTGTTPSPPGRDAGRAARVLRSATVDGAGKVRQFFSITLPSLKPT